MRPEFVVGMREQTVKYAARSNFCAGCGLSALLALALGIGSFGSTPAVAATFPDMFVVTVDVDPSARDVRAAAARRAMEILLTRVTGRPEAAQYAELAPLIQSAERLVTEYARLVGNQARVRFNANAVQSELTSLDWPIWGAERPQLALWVAVDFGSGQRVLLNASEEEAPVPAVPALPDDLEAFRADILEELLGAADERGLPVALPRLDEEDFGQIGFAGVWGGFDPLIMRASARYGADFALVARASLTELGLQVDWSLISPDGASDQLRTSTFREGIDWVANRLAAQYSSVGRLHLTRIEVEGVSSLADYGRIVNYLETVSIIDSVDVARFADDVLTLTARIRADESVLDRVFELGGVLEPADPNPVPAGLGVSERYRMTGRSVSAR
jgi:hypothetical protein